MLTPEPAALKRGWGFPANSKRAHYFVEGRSLCMKWIFMGQLYDDNHESPDNCAACKRLRARTETKASAK